ncbi:MAG TPA: enoyl-CoA hydratase/isomerase family protein [Microbacteriaceae bacterium]|jgi:enoyl-CoA hydratase/carnithine racemase|nr:enoyl-CoA hydratase/isomerase family protein [Microbacteriaceae bacterium]
MSSGAVTLEVDGPVAWIVLDRPAQRNAMSIAMREALQDALAQVDGDERLRIAVLTGAGSAFCAGADLKEASPPPLSGESVQLSAPLERFSKPLLAAINGPAIGGGLELALAADMRIASTAASFALPEVRIGSLPGSGGTQRLLHAVGPALAGRMIFTGDPLGAPEALRAGLISDVTEPHALRDRASELAERVAANAPLSLAAAKVAMRAGESAQALALERALWGLLSLTEDRAEGRQAFRERRDPRYRGR